MHTMRLVLSLILGFSLLTTIACKKDPVGPDEDPIITLPFWSGSYQNQEGWADVYDNHGSLEEGVECQVRLLITGDVATCTVQISWKSAVPALSPLEGSYTFNDVSLESDTGLLHENILEGIRYKFTASRTAAAPGTINLRYYEYMIMPDDSEILLKRVTGKVK